MYSEIDNQFNGDAVKERCSELSKLVKADKAQICQADVSMIEEICGIKIYSGQIGDSSHLEEH